MHWHLPENHTKIFVKHTRLKHVHFQCIFSTEYFKKWLPLAPGFCLALWLQYERNGKTLNESREHIVNHTLKQTNKLAMQFKL